MSTSASEDFKKKATDAVLRVRQAAEKVKAKRWQNMVSRVKQVEEGRIQEIKKKLDKKLT